MVSENFALMEELLTGGNDARFPLPPETRFEIGNIEEDESSPRKQFHGIVGCSRSLNRVLRSVEIVAPTDSTVLILGETGTGKELIARTIHELSHRHGQAFVKVNCAAIPSALLESELFGHEKGAFTGALNRKLGRCDLANDGTLFLDEIGDIPLELQPKLLRVLQEQEFERLGGLQTIRVNTRLVAATSRDLSQMVEDREFRMDLYYRLNIFPVRLPPLRQRRDDIPMLVRYFVDKIAGRMKKHIEVIPAETMERLVQHHWPGNIRELQNFIERSVILTCGQILQAPISELTRIATPEWPRLTTLAEAERAHIVEALRRSNGLVGGANGAATRLGVKRTTLSYKMKKLGISRHLD